MSHLGRNDPCHCGSGKKYKKCHLEADQRDRFSVREAAPAALPSPSLPDVSQLPELLRLLSRQGSARERKEARRLLAKVEPIVEYMLHQPEIAAASQQLEAHRAEFEQLVDDEDRHAKLVEEVFSDESFAPLRFSASDVNDAFDQVGYPVELPASKDENVETLRKAILHIANLERRSQLSTALVLRMPEYVAAGRFLQGWVLQHQAYLTREVADESNPFLFHMFSYGYNAWLAEKQNEDQALLQKLGIDPSVVASRDFEAVDAWLEAQQADPEKSAALEKLLRNHPHFREQAEEGYEALVRQANECLQREDSKFLYLGADELQPWIEVFNQRVAPRLTGLPRASEETLAALFNDHLLPFSREMAATVFTPARIQRLAGDLKTYRRRLFAAGDAKTAAVIAATIGYVEREDEPGMNTFLVSLCWTSLTNVISIAQPESSVSAA